MHLRSTKHRINGSPVYPGEHEHIGLWLTTWQRAFGAHVDIHGSTHFWLTHARFCAHSELTTHSGRQFGALPMKFGKHEQTTCSFTIRHWLFKPHGDGAHKLIGSRWTKENA